MSHPTYSQIIDPVTYNALIAVHLYIAAADNAIAQIVGYHSNGENLQVVEFGCGPARIMRLLADEFTFPNVTGIDHDKTFIEYAQKTLGAMSGTAVLADAMTYQHPVPIDIAVSQGFHHHVPKGEQTRRYLENVYRQLKPDGIYVVGDEFLPSYRTNKKRQPQAVTWYAHIIGAALKGGYTQLAVEEAKTLLDDLAEGTDESSAKSEAQIQFVLDNVPDLQLDLSQLCYRSLHEEKVEDFLRKVALMKSQQPQGNPSIDLSRGDFKICHGVFQQEVEAVGFKIRGVKTVGPIETIGGMVVYTLGCG